MVSKKGKVDVRKSEQRGGKVGEKKSCEEDWPNEQHVYGNVDWITMVSSVESKVLLQIKQSNLSHFRIPENNSHFPPKKKKTQSFTKNFSAELWVRYVIG